MPHSLQPKQTDNAQLYAAQHRRPGQAACLAPLLSRACRADCLLTKRYPRIGKGLRFVFILGATVALSTFACSTGQVIETKPSPSLASAPVPTATQPIRSPLIVGQQYWTSAYKDPLLGLSRYNPVYNKPSDDLNDPTVTVINVLRDANLVTLVGIQDSWCFVKGLDQTGQAVEGWMRCQQLLDFEPTPLPTPNLTPVAP